MTQPSLADLNPIFFLQTFILELMHASEQQGQKHCEQLIEHIARTAGCFLKKPIAIKRINSSHLIEKVILS